MSFINRALYGQALADQERTALLQINNSSRSGSQKLLSAASADSINNDNTNGDNGGGNVAGTARHPFAPQQVCIFILLKFLTRLVLYGLF